MARTLLSLSTLLALPMLGALALSAPADAAPPVAVKKSVALRQLPGAVKVEVPAKKMRVVMELTFKTTTDSNENSIPLSSNTEDEIFYGLSGARIVDGKEKAFIPTEVRPSGSRDIWEMGPNSNKTLTRTIFEGELSSKDHAVVNIAIGEQDNAQLDALTNLIKGVAQWAGDAVEKELGTEGTYDAFKGATKEEMVGDLVSLINDMGKRDDQVVGVFSVSASRTSMKVTAGAGMYSKLASQSSKAAKLALSGFGSSYTVKLRLEEADEAPRPASAVFLSEEYDKCGEDDLKISGKTIAKGQTVTVSVPDERFDWRCGGSLEHTTAPVPTNEVQVKRAASGRDITWRCFFSSTPAPDYTW